MITELFKTCLSIETLDLDLKRIQKECLKIYKKGNSRVSPRMRGFQSPNLDLNSPGFQELINVITPKVHAYAEEILKLNKKPELRNIWVNVSDHKDYNLEHMHANAMISGAFYVSAPKNCGPIYFINPVNINDFLSLYLLKSLEDNAVFTENNSRNCTQTIVPPEDGRLLLFPAWLKHGVYPNMNKTKKRISISFNYM